MVFLRKPGGPLERYNFILASCRFGPIRYQENMAPVNAAVQGLIAAEHSLEKTAERIARASSSPATERYGFAERRCGGTAFGPECLRDESEGAEGERCNDEETGGFHGVRRASASALVPLQLLDACSRYIVKWDLRESMTEAGIEIILERTKELQPLASELCATLNRSAGSSAGTNEEQIRQRLARENQEPELIS